MALHNGGAVFGITIQEERDDITREHRHLLLQHRAKHFNYLTHRIIASCKDCQEVLGYLKDNVSEYWYKRAIGRITGIILIRLYMYHASPSWYNFRGELMMSASWIICVQYLQRLTKLLTIKFGLPPKYRRFQIPSKRLHQLSSQWYDDTYNVAQKMVKHHKKLKAMTN